jgi:glycosyltransferase involved in cell wall biosynthesis
MPLPEGLRIGYVPAAADFGAPSDRRRFIYYARRRQLKVELADPREHYDLVVLNQRADLSVWSRYRPDKSRIVYEANDSYISVPSTDPKQALRGTFKFLTGQSRRLQLDYREAVREMCRRADAVTCSTDEQRAQILPLCANVHLILDFQDDDVLARKQAHVDGPVFNVVWEGLASSGIPMRLMHDILAPLARTRRVALHLVTDPVYYRWSNVVGKVHTVEQVRREFGEFARHVQVHQWSAFALSAIATAADLAIIPIDVKDTFAFGKPENKLLLLWRLGVPTITTATPAYVRAMQRAGLDLACGTSADWTEKLARLAASAEERARLGALGQRCADTVYSTDEMLGRWDRVLESLFGARGA